MHHPVNFGFLSPSVGFHALSPRVTAHSNLVAVLVLVPACCLLVASTCYAWIASLSSLLSLPPWSVLLPAVGCALLFLGSCVPSLAVSVLGFLGPFPGCFVSFEFKMSLSL